MILQNILLKIWEIQQNTIKNVCLSENFEKNLKLTVIINYFPNYLQYFC